MIFLHQQRRLLSCFLFALYFCTFSEINVLEKAGGAVLAWAEIDYPCKDHNCGCTSALKCFTDCCCDLPDPRKDSWCEASSASENTQPEAPVKSCCPSDIESEQDSELGQVSTTCSINVIPCGSSQQDYLTKIQGPPHVTFLARLSPIIRNKKPSFKQTSHTFSPQETFFSLDKVPIA